MAIFGQQSPGPNTPPDSPVDKLIAQLHTADDASRREVVDKLLDAASDIGDLDTKKVVFLAILETAEEHEYPPEASVAEIGLGNVCFQSEDYKRAIYCYERGLPGFRRLQGGDITGIERTLVTCAGYSGDAERAEKYGALLKHTYAMTGRRREIGGLENDIAFAYAEAGRVEEAARRYRHLLATISEQDRAGRSQLLYNLADIERQSKQFASSISHFEAAERDSGLSPEILANCECLLGWALLANGQPKQATARLERAIVLNRRLKEPDPSIDFGALSELTQAYKRVGNATKAKKAQSDLDEMVKEMASQEQTMSMLGISTAGGAYSTASMYGILIAHDVRVGRSQDALFEAERGKARGLVDLRRRAPIDTRQLSAAEQEILRLSQTRFQRAFEARVASFETGRPPDASLQYASEDLESCERKSRDAVFDRQIAQAPNGQGVDREIAPFLSHVRVDRLLEDLRSLPPQTVIADAFSVHELFGSEMELLLIWSDGARAHVVAQPLMEGGTNVSLARLSALCSEFAHQCMAGSPRQRGAIVNPRIAPSTTKAGAILYKMLFEPIAHLHRPFTKLVFGPDGPLWSIPVECLPTPDHSFVIDRWEVGYCYSAEQFAQARSLGPGPLAAASVLAVGDLDYGQGRMRLAPLPGAAREVLEVKRSFPGVRVLSGMQATKGQVAAMMARSSLIHFATHGLMFEDSPQASCLALSAGEHAADSFLTAADIGSMNLKARLAVLSACDTGRGTPQIGEGLLGLTHGFISGGCPSVVATLWPVDDRVSSEFMAEFYRDLAAAEPIGVSLRQAALKVKASHPAPYYWGPFVLIGDYDR